jgi:hypothetical protein
MVFTVEDHRDDHLVEDHFFPQLERMVLAAQQPDAASGRKQNITSGQGREEDAVQLSCPVSGCTIRFSTIIEAVRHLGRLRTPPPAPLVWVETVLRMKILLNSGTGLFELRRDPPDPEYYQIRILKNGKFW